MEDGEDLIQEYQQIITESVNISITNVPRNIIHNIAVWVSSTNLNDYDWENFAYEIGLKEAFVLKEIKVTAKCQQLPPEYIALCGRPFNRSGTLGEVISALLRMERFDVLYNIINDVREFLKNYENRQLPNDDVDEACCAISKKAALDYDIEPFVKSSFNFTEQFKKIFSVDCKTYLSSNDPRIQVPKQAVSISVFIPHAEKDARLAELVAQRLRKFNISVTLPSQVEFMIAIDCYGALSSIMAEVDFVLPLLTQRYMKHISPNEKNNVECNDADAMYNRFLHCCAQTEFIKNGCLNMRVRPVAMDLDKYQPRAWRRQEILFSFIFQLWDDMDRLVRILQDTKQYMLHQQPKHLGITGGESQAF